MSSSWLSEVLDDDSIDLYFNPAKSVIQKDDGKGPRLIDKDDVRESFKKMIELYGDILIEEMEDE